MNIPLLVVVTGRPASGKTTLAHILTKELKCPLLSRDELKEGYVNTIGLEHNQLDNSVTWHIYDTFFEAIELLISKGISIIVEAAFQDNLWRPKLLKLLGKAEIRVILCKTSPALAKARFANRLLDDPRREIFHGDKSFDLENEENVLMTENYEAVHIDVPTLQVDTTKNYQPTIDLIITFIRS
jgi:predicted kinase